MLGTVVPLAGITHLVGAGFDVDGRRPAAWGQFFRPRGIAPSAGAAVKGPSSPSRALSLPRKLAIATGPAFLVGIAATMVFTDDDSAVLVILRIGSLAAVLFALVVGAHPVLWRRPRQRVRADASDDR
jgi:hypothetical protein